MSSHFDSSVSRMRIALRISSLRLGVLEKSWLSRMYGRKAALLILMHL